MTQLHHLGLVQNYGPRAASSKRELPRLLPAVRKVLRRKPNHLALWCSRSWAQAKANGGRWFQAGVFNAPYSGWYVALGGRALVVLTGRSPL